LWQNPLEEGGDRHSRREMRRITAREILLTNTVIFDSPVKQHFPKVK